MRDDDGRLLVGTPDGKGGLATQSPRLRAAVRFLQIALVVAVGGPVIWAGIVSILFISLLFYSNTLYRN